MSKRKFPKDLTGLKFNKLTVIERLDFRKSDFYWKCICDCGQYAEISRSNLTKGTTKSCGCFRSSPKTNTLERKFGRLQPIKYLENKKYECLCDCGNLIAVDGALLRKGHTKSCGCLMLDKTDLVGLRFGRLLVLDRFFKNSKAVLKCLCDCGKIIETRPDRLKRGKTKSCGCLARELSIERGKLNSKENHPCWRHDWSEKERLESQNRSHNPKLKDWRLSVYSRDNYSCQICKDNKGGNLIAHHLESWSSNKELRFDLENGITLCENCHNRFHKEFGFGENTKEQFINFKNE